MALPTLIEKSQRDWLFKITGELSRHPVRDKCLLGYFLGTPCTTLEINRIQLGDVLHKSGKLNTSFNIKGSTRPVYLTSKPLQKLTLDYINHRVKNKIGLGNHPDHYMGLDPDEALFISYQKQGFSLVLRDKDKDKYTCDALNRHITMLLYQAGIKSPSILSGRRTFAVNLHRKGYDIAHIHYLLGNKTLETTKKILTTDPVEMGDIAAQAF